jgi:hypothetical protein
VHAACVQVRALGSNLAGAEQALLAFEATRRRCPSPWRDRLVYRAMARLRAHCGDWARADEDYRRALAAIDELVGEFSDAGERSRFVGKQTVLFDEARRCFEALGRSDEAERLIAPIVSPEELARRLAEDARQRDRRLVHAGVWLLFIDACCAVGAICARAVFELEPVHALNEIGLPFVIGAVGIALYLPLHFMISMLSRSMRAQRGFLLVCIGLIPWIVLLLSLFGLAI